MFVYILVDIIGNILAMSDFEIKDNKDGVSCKHVSLELKNIEYCFNFSCLIFVALCILIIWKRYFVVLTIFHQFVEEMLYYAPYKVTLMKDYVNILQNHKQICCFDIAAFQDLIS